MASTTGPDSDKISDLLFKCSLNHQLNEPTIINENVSPVYSKEMWEEIRCNKKLPVLDPQSFRYEEFFRKYLLNNVPCMFSSDITASWLSCKKWVKGDPNGSDSLIDFEYLIDTYGNAQVSIVNCDDEEYRGGYGTGDCRDMLFKEYVQQVWRDMKDHVNCRPCLYLKDWHIVRFHKTSLPEIPIPYQTPTFFQSDWLNETCDAMEGDDFKFCYIGPKGSFTSFHADVYGSYSWSANVFGVKRWYLYPPGKEIRFINPVNNRMQFDWNDPGSPGEDFIEVIQTAGECLFVPSGWHHVVWNLTDCISINHNWFNGANLCYIWTVLRNALKDVEHELDDLHDIPEFHDQCQLVLKANHGMNYDDFFKILTTVKEARKNGAANFISHAEFDVEAIRHLVKVHCATDKIVKIHFGESISSLGK